MNHNQSTTKKKSIFIFLFVSLIFIFPLVLAAEEVKENDLRTSSGIEIDELITIGSSLLATVLFILVFVAYNRSGNKRLIYVGLAFLLFAIKGFLIASDIVFPQKGAWIDPVANFLDFAILLSFFFGIIKKGV